MINSNMIKARARELGVRQKDIAAALGIKQPTANQKINGVRPMMLHEAEILATILQINDIDFGTYFFEKASAESAVRGSLIHRKRFPFPIGEGLGQLTPDEEQIISFYREMSNRGKFIVQLAVKNTYYCPPEEAETRREMALPAIERIFVTDNYRELNEARREKLMNYMSVLVREQRTERG